jgi:MFS family permease
MSSETKPRFDPRQRRAVTLALALVTTLASFESTVVSTAMPTIIGDLHGLSLYSWVFSIYLLTATVMMPLFGRLADLYGRRRVLLVAICVFLAGAALCAGARSMPQLIAARGLQGIGAAGLVPVALIVIADLYPLHERARIQGVFSGIWGGAALLGPLLGAWLTVSFGWRSVFSINLPLGALAFFLVATRMQETRGDRSHAFDYAGAAALAVAVGSLLFATLHAPDAAAPRVLSRTALLGIALAAAALFARLQAVRARPLIPPHLLAHARTGVPYLGCVFLGTTIFGVDTFVPLFVQGARGGSAMAAGAVVTPIIFFWSLSAAICAPAIVRLGYRRGARGGALLILCGFAFLLAAAAAQAPVAWISAACALIGLGLGPSSMSQVLAIQYTAPERDRGVATSLVPFFRAVGGALGVGALGGVLAAGLHQRLGDSAAVAGRMLSGHQGAVAGADAAQLRGAIEQSLWPVFLALVALATVNFVVTSWFPEGAAPGEQPRGGP